MFELSRLLPHLQCPRSGNALSLREETLVSPSGHSYQIVNRKPVLVKVTKPHHIAPPPREFVSRNIPEFVLDPTCPSDGLVLHLGCGDVPSFDPRVVSVDVLPTNAADVVAEAEALPFRDNTFDRVISGAVFEHLYDPVCAAKEVRRVVKEGGSFYIDTAFLQGYHGFPSHFFNMTSQAVETYLVDDFCLLTARVPDSGTVGYTITGVLRRFLDYLPPDKAKVLLDMSLGQILEEFEADSSRKNRFIGTLSEYSQRSLAASFVVTAKKPHGYSEMLRGDLRSEQPTSVKREYYAARMAVIQRHHEIEYYRRRSGGKLEGTDLPRGAPPLDDILSKYRPPENCSFLEAVAALQLHDEALTVLRNKWIGHL